MALSDGYFSPDSDGYNDTLTIKLGASDDSSVANWSFEIHEPQPPYLLFYRWEGEGDPPDEVIWDGKSKSGELVQSASDYPYIFAATDSLGNENKLEGAIPVDVLVMKETGPSGETLMRVQVPSIVFGANSGGFDGLDEETRANNDFILMRIAQVLLKFGNYRVKVEGHANPVARNDRDRQQEQTRELQPLSEQRARTIVDYLVSLGIERTRLTAYGIGGARPIVSYEDRNNWWKNRRVEFILER
jgi:outer membrane protein OmpA-like peptidoglycan-associated protein